MQQAIDLLFFNFFCGYQCWCSYRSYQETIVFGRKYTISIVLHIPFFCCCFNRLPRKTDMERKIEIVQFASRTRQLFVRLLALVKWANNAGKVEKCAVSKALFLKVA
uniref:Mediator of RNA polymerase II transcription subunit 14 n=1 Tax=Ornithorhynchus anatinus TaxID=9258 RepID=A0A6I8NGQ5_ORNAN